MSIVLALFAGCGEAPQPAPPAVPTAPLAAQPDRAAQLNALYAEFWEDSLKHNPLEATQVGDPRYNAELPNLLAPEYRAATKALAERYLDSARKIGSAGLTGQDLLSYELFESYQRDVLEGLEYPSHLAPLNQFYSFANQFATLGSGSTAQPFKTVRDYDDWLARAAKIPAIFDQAIVNMREGMAAGIVQPKVLMEKVLPQLDQQIVDKLEDSTYYGPIKAFPDSFSADDKARLTAAFEQLISTALLPAYQRLRTFVADEYLPAARDTVGLGALPNGAKWYEFQVRQNTTTDLSAEQIHQIGLDEVKRIHAEMEALKTTMGIQGTLKDYFAAMKADPNNYFGDELELLAAYGSFRSTIEPKLASLFDIQPKADFEIRPVEAFRAASASSGQYNGPSEDGTRAGIFYVNTFDLRARPRWALESLYLHEATPGHHFQIALQRELTDLPKFRRFGNETAFAEGWGLYAESLGKELGVFTDPVMQFGALDAELWRSIRLVADTGIHAKGWTREQVLDYMYANSPAEPTRAIAEAERFMAIPGQALAYKIGQLKIRELRNRATSALGDKFDVKAFHREVLKDGSLPLDVLEKKIDRWIAAQK
jgi:uncharacterized protein (DUF885 family)